MGPRIFFPVVDGEESKMVTQTEWVQVSPCCRCCFSQLGFGCWHKCIGKKVGSSNCLLECPNTVRPSRARVLLDILLFWYKGGCCTISPCCWSFFNNFFSLITPVIVYYIDCYGYFMYICYEGKVLGPMKRVCNNGLLYGSVILSKVPWDSDLRTCRFCVSSSVCYVSLFSQLLFLFDVWAFGGLMNVRYRMAEHVVHNIWSYGL